MENRSVNLKVFLIDGDFKERYTGGRAAGRGNMERKQIFFHSRCAKQYIRWESDSHLYKVAGNKLVSVVGVNPLHLI